MYPFSASWSATPITQSLIPKISWIKTTTGASVTLDGDLLAVMEALYREVTAKREFERSFEDMVREIQHLIDQMTAVVTASVA